MKLNLEKLQDMDPILALLETHDFISYQEKGLRLVAASLGLGRCLDCLDFVKRTRRSTGAGLHKRLQLQSAWWKAVGVSLG